ncbi:MAG: hypothetical protein NZM04_02565 [Methylacidiphilales bacterium]|nr:hypothetical protein [Candidatus Methylacidiphilales bacterium]
MPWPSLSHSPPTDYDTVVKLDEQFTFVGSKKARLSYHDIRLYSQNNA